MEHLGEFMAYAVMMIFAQNVLLGRAMGADVILNMISKKRSLLTLSGIIAVYSTLGIMVMWAFGHLELGRRGYLICGLGYSLMCLGAYFFSDRMLLRISPESHDVWGSVLPFALINSVIIGLPAAVISDGMMHWYGALGCGFGTGVSFALGAFIVKNGYDILENPDMPNSFMGMPAMLLYIGVMSLGFCVFM